MNRFIVLVAAVVFTACSGSPAGGASSTSGGGGSSGNTAPPACTPTSVAGTYHISGEFDGYESICGLQIGSFDAGALTISAGTTSGVVLTITGSTGGHLDVDNCSGTLTNCQINTSNCPGSTDVGEQVSLTVNTYPDGSEVNGTSYVSYNSCQVPGMSFHGPHE